MIPRDYPLASILESTVGAYFLGAVASVGLSGITTLQSWLYFQKCPQDPVSYKLLVAFTWTLEILRSCIAVQGGYYYSVQHWGNVIALLEPIWSMKVMVLLTDFVELGVHCFFVHKVWKATRAKVLPSVIMVFVVAAFALGLATYITATMETSFTGILQGTPKHIATAGLSCAIGADWLITFALVRFFRESKTSFRKTNHLLNRLIFYAINMGLLTSVTDAIVLIFTVVAWPTFNLYQLSVYQVVGSLYANSLLACLNARDTTYEEEKLSRPLACNMSAHLDIATESSNQGRVQIQVSRQLWTSSEVSHPAFELKPQATKSADAA